MRLPLWLLNLGLRAGFKAVLALTKTPQEMRAKIDRDAALLFRAPDDANFLADSLRRADGSRMEMLWASRGRPDRRRVLLYLHGGAYLAGSPRTHRHLGALLGGVAGARVLLPDYRLAPEHPFPAAVEDALAAYRHLLDSGYAPGQIALAGDSAGGGLVFALLLKLQALGLPRPSSATGFSPWTDMTLTSDSLRRNARRDVMLPVRRMPEVVAVYLAGAAPDDPLASPALGTYDDPPPTLILASKSEILRDDAAALADRLRAAGGDVALELWKNLPHGWPILAGWLRQADQSIERAGAFMADHFANGGE